MNKFIKSVLVFALALFLTAGSVSALTDTVTITDLPEYTRTDTFELSYSALSDNPITAQFYYMKEGGTYAVFGPVLNGSSGQVQVTSGQVDEQVKYYFKIEINGGTASAETSVFFDKSGPSPVQNYWKERIAPETYRLHWKNPGDSDFSRTFIYKSESREFDANNSTKIGELGGAPDDEMSYDVLGLDPSKEYYFGLRAVDHAGNPASLVSDGGGTIIEETVVTQAEGGDVLLPSEDGEVLGEESEDKEATEESKSITEKLLDTISLDEDSEANTWGRVRTFILVFGGVWVIWRLFFRKKKK